jgi:MoaA/NifB/PqqE/SkfB family radical SAM enzyme
MPIKPTIEWHVAGACNYDCSYCIQSTRYRQGKPEVEKIDNALNFFASLPGVWEIKCSGGEAFAHKLFIDQIVPGLMDWTPHYISVLTNFSASREELERFVSLTRDRLHVFSASLHLEFIELAAFADKAQWFVGLLDPKTRFVINQVVLPGKEHEALACRHELEGRGLRWFPQLFKTGGGVADYPNKELLLQVIGRAPTPREANTAPSWKGHLCWAGTKYFTVDKDGEAWSCRTAKRFKQGRLGNIYQGDVTLWPTASYCPYEICPCTVPANRGIIEGVPL